MVLCLAFWLGFAAHAQGQEDRDKIKALKVAFFTEQLSLTPEEAKAFWPLYNAFEQEREALREKQRKEIRDRIASPERLSEPEARKILDRYLALEAEEERLDRDFYRNLAREFSATRALKLFRAEQDFRRRLMQEYRKRRGNRP